MIRTGDIPLPVMNESTDRLVHHYLHEQERLTAVEQFSRLHDEGVPSQAKYYRDLMPASSPQPGQQYAFEVDLDACTGCKACVAACHNLNGLDETEAWRDVGLLVGDVFASQQHVTTACHHCVEPGCLEGCPVKAYEKDPVTGIVRHLDDQCIGCQYCILKCPYDVPKYNDRLGIVRKCDMCTDRLAEGEAPACVQACPNQAIRIVVVNQSSAIATAEAANFLPASPDPMHTKPTTRYRSQRSTAMPTRAADDQVLHPEHAHLPLVVMLTLSQLSVGAFAVGLVMSLLQPTVFAPMRAIHASMALALCLVALASSTLHLGRPLYAFRAVLGLRTSWLSREIVALGGFAKMAIACTALLWWQPAWLSAGMMMALQAMVVLAGLGGVFCSAMIYHDTPRVLWHIRRTGVRFALTTLLLGLATTIGAAGIFAAIHENFSTGDCAAFVRPLAGVLVFVTLIKLALDASILRHLRPGGHATLRKTAKLMVGPLHRSMLARFVMGFMGGVLVPLWLVPGGPESGGGLYVAIGLTFGFSIAGELLERYQFFTAVIAPRMPGVHA